MGEDNPDEPTRDVVTAKGIKTDDITSSKDVATAQLIEEPGKQQQQQQADQVRIRLDMNTPTNEI